MAVRIIKTITDSTNITKAALDMITVANKQIETIETFKTFEIIFITSSFVLLTFSIIYLIDVKLD